MSKRVAVLLGLGVVAAGVYVTGAFEYARPATLRDVVLGWGPWGPVLFVACFALGQLLGLPGQPFLLAAALTWRLPVAFAVAWVGAVLAGFPSFLLARYVARDWVQAHLPPRFRRYDTRLAEHGLRTVILLRLVFFLSPVLPPALALSRVRAAEFALGTAIALLPEVILWTLFGPRLVAWLFGLPPEVWWRLALSLLVVLAAVLVYGRRRRRAAAAPVPPLPQLAPQSERP